MKVCVDCRNSFNQRVKRDGRWVNSNRSRCYDCVPYKTSPYSRRYGTEEKRPRSADKMKAWRSKRIEITGIDPVLLFRQRRKEHIVSVLGGGCQICKYNKCLRNLSFHHVLDKVFQLDQRAFQSSAKRLLPELKKCILVCQNCHGEIHHGMVKKTVIISILKQNKLMLLKGIDLPSSKI